MSRFLFSVTISIVFVLPLLASGFTHETFELHEDLIVERYLTDSLSDSAQSTFEINTYVYEPVASGPLNVETIFHGIKSATSDLEVVEFQVSSYSFAQAKHIARSLSYSVLHIHIARTIPGGMVLPLIEPVLN